MKTTGTSSTSTGNVRVLLVLLNSDMPVSPHTIPPYSITINRSRGSANTVARGSAGVAAVVVVIGGRGTVFGSALGHYCCCHCCYCQSLTATPSILANSRWKAKGVREWRAGVDLMCAKNKKIQRQYKKISDFFFLAVDPPP